MKLHERLFPHLANAKWKHIKLNDELMAMFPFAVGEGKQTNFFLNPKECSSFIDILTRKEKVDFTYGGYLENRSGIWRSSYLEKEQKWIHLGIDYNVPAQTSVYMPVNAKVINIWHDKDQDGGWGTRIDFKVNDKVNLHIAHLSSDICVNHGEFVGQGSLIGHVGDSKFNGGWFPHLHVQCTQGWVFPDRIDGYEPESCHYYSFDPEEVL